MPHHQCPDLITLWLGGIAALFGGLVRWYENGLFGKGFSAFTFLLDMFISAGAGVLVYWFVHDLGQTGSVCAIAAAITGNIGGRVFDVIRILFKRKTGIEIPDAGKRGEGKDA